jgi:hypothetical protein
MKKEEKALQYLKGYAALIVQQTLSRGRRVFVGVLYLISASKRVIRSC